MNDDTARVPNHLESAAVPTQPWNNDISCRPLVASVSVLIFVR